MRRVIPLLLVLAFCACAKGGDDAALYRDPAGGFALRGPDSWRVLENQGGAQRVSFFGPAGGQQPFAAMISVYYYAKEGKGYARPQNFAAAKQVLALESTPLRKIKVNGAEALEFTVKRLGAAGHGRLPIPLDERSALVPTDQGFFAIVYSAPSVVSAESLPAFEQVLRSFEVLE
ncbi:MAG: hypothetical protein ABIJ96_14775 [Elusimicrobiota bacterium]